MWRSHLVGGTPVSRLRLDMGIRERGIEVKRVVTVDRAGMTAFHKMKAISTRSVADLKCKMTEHELEG
jgi:hypothetical protein